MSPRPSIRFDQPKVGQCTQYVHLQKQGSKGTYQALGDTLTVCIVADLGNNSFTLEETIQAGSSYYRQAPEPRRYQLDLGNNHLQIKTEGFIGSALFRSFSEPIPLNLKTGPPIQDLEFGTSIPGATFGSYQFAVAPQAHIQGATYQNINVVKNAAPMAYDGPGEMLCYSKEAGIVKSISYGAMVQLVTAWERLP